MDLNSVLIIVGIFAGGFFGVEYGNWRVSKRVHRYELLLFMLLGLDFDEFYAIKDPPLQKAYLKRALREHVKPMVQNLWKEFFPDLNIPRPPPSRVKTLNGRKLFVPHCEKCGFAGAPVYDVNPGVLIEAACPTHGKYRVRIPEQNEKEVETE